MTKIGSLKAENSVLRERIARLEAQLAAERSQVGPPLEAEQTQFRALFESMELGVVYHDADGSISMANPAAERILGLPLDEMQGRKSIDPRWRAVREDGSDFPGEEHPAMQVLRTGKVVKNVIMGVFHSRENEIRWILITAVPEFHAGESRPYRVYATFADITALKLSDNALRESQQRYQFTVNAANVGTWDWSIQSGEVIVNERWAEMLGYTLAELAPVSIQTWINLVHPDDWKQASLVLKKHFHGEIENYQFECRMRHKHGQWVWVMDRGRVISRDSQGKPVRMLGAHTDINVLKQTEENIRTLNAELQHLAVTDFLTNLPNRRFFTERGREEFKRSRRNNQALSLFMMDIDHFKNINDNFGHEVGDQILQQVAAILKSNLREIDLPARIGGEEFVALLENTSLEDAFSSAERVRDAISKSVFRLQSHEISCTASFGVAILTDEMANLDGLIRKADDAMYRAKRAGRNRVMQ